MRIKRKTQEKEYQAKNFGSKWDKNIRKVDVEVFKKGLKFLIVKKHDKKIAI